MAKKGCGCGGPKTGNGPKPRTGVK